MSVYDYEKIPELKLKKRYKINSCSALGISDPPLVLFIVM